MRVDIPSIERFVNARCRQLLTSLSRLHDNGPSEDLVTLEVSKSCPGSLQAHAEGEVTEREASTLANNAS
jgi:hypothetical protein